MKRAGLEHLIDVRLNNTSQLAGYTKKPDLEYLLNAICGMTYDHMPELAPTLEMLKEYRGNGRDWGKYSGQYLNLLAERHVQNTLPRHLFQTPTVVLCSEHCHRRLLLDYLNSHGHDIEIINL
jgi:hypothetical protein